MKSSRRAVVHMLLASVWAVSLLVLVFPARAQAQADRGGTHVVAAGETLSQIARQYGTGTASLMALNGIADANLVYAGQKLVVPSSGSSQTQWAGEPERTASTYERQSSQWESPTSSGPYQRAGVAWEPQGERRSPYRDDWERRPVADSSSASDNDAWQRSTNQSATNQRTPYLEEWETLHNERSSHRPGNSWEPQANKQPVREQTLTGEKWIDVNLSEQVLTAYQGDTVVRTFVISSGSARYPTVTGSFRTYARTELQDMWGGSKEAGDYYFQPDVPWVQYFFEDYAIHGAYWHNNFGTPTGHGCINMRVEDSRWLYEWTGVTGIRVEVHY